MNTAAIAPRRRATDDEKVLHRSETLGWVYRKELSTDLVEFGGKVGPITIWIRL